MKRFLPKTIRSYFTPGGRRPRGDGFTLMEIVVVLGITTAAFSSIGALALQNLQVQKQNEYFITAAMLAQEGLELVRNKRDRNWLVSFPALIDWKDGDSPGTDSDILQVAGNYSYAIDHEGIIDSSVDDITAPGARLHINSGFYSHDTAGLASPFSRLVTVTDISPEEIEVSVEVRWQNRGQTHNHIANGKLYDWR